MDRDELVKILTINRIPIHRWGTGKAKTLEHLLVELKEGESALRYDCGRLLRVVQTAAVIIYYTRGDGLLVLTQNRQVFNDGRERKLERESSISEKLKPGESPEVAAQRAFAEELQITEPLELVPLFCFHKGPTDLGSYPELLTRYDIHLFTTALPEHLFRLEGYVEKAADKTNYFDWKPALL